jgi:hypothetical protein
MIPPKRFFWWHALATVLLKPFQRQLLRVNKRIQLLLCSPPFLICSRFLGSLRRRAKLRCHRILHCLALQSYCPIDLRPIAKG